jgi:hypothetical protein
MAVGMPGMEPMGFSFMGILLLKLLKVDIILISTCKLASSQDE